MPLFRFDLILQAASLFPADNIVNTFHFSNDNPTVSDYDNVRDMLEDFFNLDPATEGSTGPLGSYIAGSLLQENALVKAYELVGGPSGPPVYESQFAGAWSVGTTPLPAEVALCLSFQGEPQAGVPQARQRNRKYIGPFNTTAIGTGGRPSVGLVATLAGAGRRLREASTSSINWEWMWHSGTTGGYGLIYNGWVDNAWDTQRRRGEAPDSRLLWDVDLPPDE